MIDVKEAVKIAKDYVMQFYDPNEIPNSDYCYGTVSQSNQTANFRRIRRADTSRRRGQTAASGD